MESCFFIGLLLLSCLAQVGYGGGVLFSSLPKTLVLSVSPQQGQVLNAGEDKITVRWGLNNSLPQDTDKLYKEIKIKLCYAPISQVDRAWRKTLDNLSKDKTCQFTIAKSSYEKTRSSVWIIEKGVPTATYFIRAYAYNGDGEEVAYGQTTDYKKSSYLFEVKGISGRLISIDVASVCFSAFCLVSLLGFFMMERRNRPSRN